MEAVLALIAIKLVFGRQGRALCTLHGSILRFSKADNKHVS